MKYLTVRNLDRYQHYKDRDPKWIKLYYSILDDEAFIFLSETLRCRYITCLILASRSNNRIPSDPLYLKKVMRLDKPPDLQPLIDIGFLVYTESSTCLDICTSGLSVSPLLSSPLSSLNGIGESERKGNGRACSLPEDFIPNDRAKELAKGQGQNVLALCAAFKDHHTAKGTLFKDWQAAFRTWLRNDLKFKEARR